MMSHRPRNRSSPKLVRMNTPGEDMDFLMEPKLLGLVGKDGDGGGLGMPPVTGLVCQVSSSTLTAEEEEAAAAAASWSPLL